MHPLSHNQYAEKVLSNSSEKVDFHSGYMELEDCVCDLPDGQVKFLGKILEEIQITKVFLYM